MGTVLNKRPISQDSTILNLVKRFILTDVDWVIIEATEK